MSRSARGVLAGFAAVLLAGSGWAQESRSAALAKQLTAALDAANLDSIAAKDPSAEGTYVAALYFKGAQLLVVSAKYAAPTLLDAKLAQKDFRDVYIDLNSASVPESKVFIEDLGADGLRPKRGGDNDPFDSYEQAGKRVAFDGDWKAQKISEQDYMKTYSAADERYSQILQTLLEQVKKTS
jgi:hypothetical protein